jgi:hypothetical protein
MRTFSYLTFSAFVFLMGCAIREEGPAEKFGRHIDDITSDINDMAKDDAKKAEERDRLNRARANQAQTGDPSDYYRRPAPADDAPAAAPSDDHSGDRFDSRRDDSRSKPNDFRY